MAQTSVRLTERISRLLDDLTSLWGDVPRVAGEIDQWDLLDQLGYTEEWPSHDGRLHEFEQYVAEGALDPEQLARYSALKRLIAQHEPLLQQVMEG